MSFGHDLAGIGVIGGFICPDQVTAKGDSAPVVEFINAALFLLLDGANVRHIPAQGGRRGWGTEQLRGY
jgi:hypothetical protein